MQAFSLLAADIGTDARDRRSASPGRTFIAGGTDLMQLMKDNVEAPTRLVDLERCRPVAASRSCSGGLRLGAMARHERRRRPSRAYARGWPVIAEALLASRLAAGAQHGHHRRQPAAAHALRLFPRHRFRLQQARARLRLPGDRRREPHAGDPRRQRALHRDASVGSCGGADGARCVAGTARRGRRAAAVPIGEFYRLPGDTPHIETVLRAGRDDHRGHVPASAAARRSHYLKVRDRASFEFALVSAAVALEIDGGSDA